MPKTDTVVYIAPVLVMKKKSFISLTPGDNFITLCPCIPYGIEEADWPKLYLGAMD